MKKLLLLSTVAFITLSYPAFAKDDGHGHGNGEHGNEEKPYATPKDSHSGHGDNDDHSTEKAKKKKGDDGHGHGESGGAHGDEEEASAEIDLTPESIKEAGIIVEPLTLQSLESEVKAPGEVTLNSYLSSKVVPRIRAQVVARHAKLGDIVEKGQPLVTLSSVDMAQAIGELMVAHKEWKRVKQLGSSAVSAKRYNTAKIADEQARAKVIAYGMTKEQVKDLHEKGSNGSPGEFQLVAPQGGTIVSDDFIEGELIEEGRVLFNIVNESSLWIESRLSPKDAKSVKIGANARINIPDNGWLQGKVVQKHHLLDDVTRTIGVRIAVDNKEDLLHPGMYVDTRIQSGDGQKYLAVPTASVLRSPDGDWVVFVENKDKSGEFKPVEIKALRTVKDYTVIKGLPEGTPIVTQGAFFVQSELAKGGFAVHNH